MIERRFCPKCKSENVEPLMGIGGFHGIFRCRECDFSGSIFPVKEFIEKKKSKKIGVVQR